MFRSSFLRLVTFLVWFCSLAAIWMNPIASYHNGLAAVRARTPSMRYGSSQWAGPFMVVVRRTSGLNYETVHTRKCIISLRGNPGAQANTSTSQQHDRLRFQPIHVHERVILRLLGYLEKLPCRCTVATNDRHRLPSAEFLRCWCIQFRLLANGTYKI